MLLTIGHSNRRADEFIDLLRSHGVTAVADVRAVPRSRRNPHFSLRNLHALLAEAGMAYEHFRALGGHRQPRVDSVNSGWRDDAFRGYADYMRQPAFLTGIDALLDFSEKYLVAMMCAESQWRQCHRQLVADALLVRAVEVRHIMTTGVAELHVLPPFARVTGTTIEYPALF